MQREIKVRAVTLGSADYKEKDKLITIFSLELGRLSVVAKGVKNANAKLKFVTQVYCFAELVLAERNGFYVITEANTIDSFYQIAEDYDKNIIASSLLETALTLLKPGEINETYFIHLLKSLKAIAYSSVNPFLLGIKNLLNALLLSGYQLNFSHCFECNCKFVGDVYINYKLGELTCINCKGSYNEILQKQEFSVLKIVHNTEMERLETIKIKDQSVLINTLRILKINFSGKLNCKLNSLNLLN